MVNRVILVGNLGRDPEVRRLENGTAVAKFPIATNEKYKDKSGELKTLTEWHDVVMWRQLAELGETMLKKGALVYLEGKLTHRQWQDQNGNSRTSTEVVANNFRLLSKRESYLGDSSAIPKDPHDNSEDNAFQLDESRNSGFNSEFPDTDADLPF